MSGYKANNNMIHHNEIIRTIKLSNNTDNMENSTKLKNIAKSSTLNI